MSCYKEALVLRKFSKNSKINFFAQNPFQTILGKLFFFTVIFFSQHLKILAILVQIFRALVNPLKLAWQRFGFHAPFI
jgi:glucan phosphoethanolaminetransferase (alkaline phosphatase superfamily)